MKPFETIAKIFKGTKKDEDWLESGKYLIQKTIKDLVLARNKIAETYRDNPGDALRNFDRMVRITKNVNWKRGDELGIPEPIRKQMNYNIDIWVKDARNALIRELEGMKR